MRHVERRIGGHGIRRLSVAKFISTCAEGAICEKPPPLLDPALAKKFNVE
jgi:hypothetical protein